MKLWKIKETDKGYKLYVKKRNRFKEYQVHGDKSKVEILDLYDVINKLFIKCDYQDYVIYEQGNSKVKISVYDIIEALSDVFWGRTNDSLICVNMRKEKLNWVDKYKAETNEQKMGTHQ